MPRSCARENGYTAVVEQSVQLDCYNCKILYPGMPKCGVCKGSGKRLQPAMMADDAHAHEILRDALERLNRQEGTILSGRSHLVRTLILWQIYGGGYIAVEMNLSRNTPEFDRELLRLRDRIVTSIRAGDRM
jgi:hypothetical protein